MTSTEREAWRAEVDHLHAALEQQTLRAVHAEQEVQQLRAEIERLKAAAVEVGAAFLTAQALNRKRGAEIERLKDEVRASNDKHIAYIASKVPSAFELDELRAELAQERFNVQQATEHLVDYAREIERLKSGQHTINIAGTSSESAGTVTVPCGYAAEVERLKAVVDEAMAQNERFDKRYGDAGAEVERLRAAAAKHHTAGEEVLPGILRCYVCGETWQTYV